MSGRPERTTASIAGPNAAYQTVAAMANMNNGSATSRKWKRSRGSDPPKRHGDRKYRKTISKHGRAGDLQFEVRSSHGSPHIAAW